MRPNESPNDAKLYECYDCGKRVEDPETRFCSACGGELRNISLSRDL